MLVLKGAPAPGGEPALPQALLIVPAIFDQSLDRATIAGIGPCYAFLSHSNNLLPVYHKKLRSGYQPPFMGCSSLFCAERNMAGMAPARGATTLRRWERL